MLRVTADNNMSALASSLADLLGNPLPDPMAAEWIAVPTSGAQRWLRLELARRLGTSGGGRTDGVAANLDMVFPGALTRRILDPDVDRRPDPWELERVAWVVLGVLADNSDDTRLGPLLRPVPGATAWGRARRLADLLDRYLLHRPEMIRQWVDGNDVDGIGMPLPERALWQPHLWRLVRDRIGRPSPAELRPERIAALRAGDCPDGVPDRISLFGLTTVPGGSPFLELLDAVATQRDVHLFLHQPSEAMTAEVRAAITAEHEPVLYRADDTTGDAVHHPLLRSWARPAREAVVLLGDRIENGSPVDDSIPTDSKAGADTAPTNLLQRLQADIAADTAPAGDFTPADDDRSVRIHSCHGATRQVEVLRDQILHLLADDPTLTEDDIVVICPALDQFAPLIESVFGPSAPSAALPGEGDDETDDGDVPSGPPALSYRITDRSLRTSYPLLGALAALIELLGSRFSDAAVLEFANLAPVRDRFGFSDTDLTQLADWVDDANTRWGLDGEHRSRWGIPAQHQSGSWTNALDRLLLGIAVTDDAAALAAGEILPIAVEGSDISVAGRLADMIGRLARLVREAEHPRPVTEWTYLLQRAADELFAVDDQMAWQKTRLTNVLTGIADAAVLDQEPNAVDLSLADIRHVIGGELGGAAGRSDFFRGGVTISSLTPLRGLPYEVVCLLGMDESAFAVGSPDGDDLTAENPHIGDRDRRADARGALLDSVLAAESKLIVIRSDRSVITNQPVPAAVVAAELSDVIDATLDPADSEEAMKRIEVVHPRQGFDERNFVEIAGGDNEPGLDGPWSFDRLARDGARARGSDGEVAGLLTERLDAPEPSVIDLADLRDFLTDPVKYFIRRVLDVRLPDDPDRSSGKLVAPTPGSSGVARAAQGRDLLLELDGLEAWKVKDRLLDHLRADGELDSFLQRESARDVLPPGRLAQATLSDTVEKVMPLCDRLAALGSTGEPPDPVGIDITLPDGTRVVGAVRDDKASRPGPITVTVSNFAEKQRLVPWLDTIALTAQDPTRPWQAVLLNPPPKRTKKGYQDHRFEIPSESADIRQARATEYLELVVDLFRRGQREPLPLFPKLSPALHRGISLSTAWIGFEKRGDGNDKWVQLAFNHANLDQMLAMPTLDEDPPGVAAARAERYARHLWEAVDGSLKPLAHEGEGEGS